MRGIFCASESHSGSKKIPKPLLGIGEGTGTFSGEPREVELNVSGGHTGDVGDLSEIGVRHTGDVWQRLRFREMIEPPSGYDFGEVGAAAIEVNVPGNARDMTFFSK